MLKYTGDTVTPVNMVRRRGEDERKGGERRRIYLFSIGGQDQIVLESEHHLLLCPLSHCIKKRINEI